MEDGIFEGEEVGLKLGFADDGIMDGAMLRALVGTIEVLKLGLVVGFEVGALGLKTFRFYKKEILVPRDDKTENNLR